jgi:predicted transcriptional regulator
LVAEFASSGMGRSEFCQSRGLSFSTLDRHLKKLKNQPVSRRRRTRSREGKLVRVELAEAQPTRHPSGCSLTVVVPGGRRVEVQPGFDLPTLERLINALERS